MSDINEVGSTAFFIAGIREKEKDREHPLFNDPYAEWFVNDEIREKVRQVFTALPEGMELVRYRSCLFDAIAKREIESGMRQIVVLGSGFDMRALMFQTEGVRFCDVDQPAVLAFKGKVLESHGVTPCAGIPCNYLQVDLPEMLAEAGFDLDAPILFIWEGNTMYLPEELIYGFLSGLTGRIRSFKIAFDFFARSVIDRTTGDEQITATTDAFQKTLDIKWVTGFDDLSVVEERTGLKEVEFGSLLDFGQQVAPDFPADIPQLKLYLYGIMSHGAP
jgi:methyltransferase (TIGR00027 family)